MKKQPTSPSRLAEKLFQIRSDLNLSQNQILSEIGFKERLFRCNVSQYESGKREPPLLVLLAYARLAGVTLEMLVDDELDLSSDLRMPLDENSI